MHADFYVIDALFYVIDTDFYLIDALFYVIKICSPHLLPKKADTAEPHYF